MPKDRTEKRDLTRKTALVITIGCRLNQADTALINSRLTQAGYDLTKTSSKNENIDLIVLNTCAVTQTATRKSRQAARKMRSKHPKSTIVVTGCGPQTAWESWKEEKSVDLVLANSDKQDLIDAIQGEKAPEFHEFNPDEKTFRESAQGLFPFKSRAFVKIQDGCNAFCSYCLVPYARGRERSRASDEVISEVREQSSKGFQEIVLTGVNICAYNDGNWRLPELLDELSNLPGDFRIRLSSLEPHIILPEVIDLMAERQEKICRFLHLPLQHGSDQILKSMRRPYTCAEYADFIFQAHERVPGIHLGADLIVGFPGETPELFDECEKFIESLPLANLHTFNYSPRDGTPAAKFANQVPGQIAKERHLKLDLLEKNKSEIFLKSQINKKLSVLIEEKTGENSFEGWSDNYIRVSVQGENLEKNTLVNTFTENFSKDKTKLLARPTD